MVTRLSAGIAALLLTTAALAESPFIPNSIKYRDAGVKPATGRSGSATIEAYVLLGKDNTATIEVATPAPGVIEKVQFKRVAADVTNNFHPESDSNTFSASVSGVTFREAVQVQANVSGVDGARMDVVTVQTTVARRPDLAVESISAAPHAVAGGPIRVAALVRELNGDVGARASCILSANGVDVDRADDIWIDAGSSVNCMFAPNFTNTGEQSFTVRVDSVRPGDDDSSNDSMSGSMQLYASASEFTSWSASIQQRDYTNREITRAYWGFEDELETGFEAESQFSAYLANRNVDLPNLKVSSRETTDGQVIFEANDVQLDIFPPQYPSEPTFSFTRNGEYQMWELCDIPFAFRHPG